MLKPYGRSSITRTSMFVTLSSRLNTSGSSHEPNTFMGVVSLLVELAARSHPCQRGLNIDCPPLPLLSTKFTNAIEV